MGNNNLYAVSGIVIIGGIGLWYILKDKTPPMPAGFVINSVFCQPPIVQQYQDWITVTINVSNTGSVGGEYAPTFTQTKGGTLIKTETFQPKFISAGGSLDFVWSWQEWTVGTFNVCCLGKCDSFQCIA